MRQLEHLYLVICSDGATYCAGPQKGAGGENIPGGPLAYQNRGDAQLVAERIGGSVKPKMLWPLTQKCIEKGVVLWIRKADGAYAFIPETVPDTEPEGLVRMEGAEREAAISASRELGERTA